MSGDVSSRGGPQVHALGLVVACVALLAFAEPAAAEDATHYQLNERHDGYAATPAAPSAPKPVWTRDFGAQASNAIIADGRVYVSAWTGSITAPVIYALDARTGKTLWSRLGGTGDVGLSYWNEALYAASYWNGTEAIDARTGEILWPADRAPYRADAPAVVADGVLLQNTGGSSGQLHAHDARTGDFLWSARVNSSDASPSVGDGAAFLSSFCGGTTRVELADGAKTWIADRGGSFSCSQGRMTVFGDDGVHVREDDSTPPNVALDLDTGEEVHPFDSTVPPVLTPQLRLTVTGGGVNAHDRETNELIWRFAQPGDPVRIPPIAVGNRVAVASWSGEIHWLDLSSGRSLWETKLSTRAKESQEDSFYAFMPEGLSAGNGLLTFSADGEVAAFRIDDIEAPQGAGPTPGPAAPPANPSPGSVAYMLNAAHDGAVDQAKKPPLATLWERDLGNDASYPLIVGDLVYTLAERRGVAVVTAHKRKSGKRVWSHEIPQDTEDDGGAGLAYDEGKVYLTSLAPEGGPSQAIAFDARTGAESWRVDMEGRTTAPPVADQGTLLATDGDGVVAFDGSNGAEIWDRDIRLAAESSPTIVGDAAAVSYECYETHLMDLASGESRWSWTFPACSTSPGGLTAPIRGGEMYANEGRILDLANGDVLRYHPRFNPAPALGERIKVTLLGRGIVAADRSTDLVAWTFSGKGRITTLPVIVGDYVYVATDERRLYALRMQSGAVAWQGRLAKSPVDQTWPLSWDPAFAATSNTLALPLVGGTVAVYSIGR